MDAWLILWNLIGVTVFMTVAFIIAYNRKRLDTVDAAWGGGFVVAGWLVAGLELHWRTVLIAILIDVWAIRLTSHILERNLKKSEDDPRYTQIASKWSKKYYWLQAYISIFLLQAVLVVVVSLPTAAAAGRDTSWAVPLAIIGSVIWLKGFAIEAIGDRQLRAFIADKSNKGKVLETGLWKYTRHPNYLGEITQWYGLGIIACGARYGWIGLTGPITLNVLIRFVSGVPPIEKRKAKDPAYSAYMKRTNAILPRLQRDL